MLNLAVYWTPQIFVTPDTLYLVLWSLAKQPQPGQDAAAHRTEMIQELAKWATLLQTCSPGAKVQLVGSHKDEVADALAPDVEYRLRDLVQEALKFMKHGRRETLSTDDINFALRLRSAEQPRRKRPAHAHSAPGSTTHASTDFGRRVEVGLPYYFFCRRGRPLTPALTSAGA